jgi:abnormal spindle-like microcephaly-associated protein
MVQKTFRRYKALLNFKQIQENDFYNKKVILVQSIWRGHFVRIQVRRTQAAVLIQKNWRCYVQNVDFVITVISAIKIQAFSRQAMARIKFEGKKTAAILIQRRIRGMLKRNLVRRYNQNSSIIQKWWRNILSDRIRCKAITAVQSAARGMLVRKSIRTQIEAACSIQKLWRGYRTNVDYLWTMLTVIRLQAIFRGSLARRKATSLRLKMEELALENRKKAKAATVIQQAYRLALGKKLMIKNILLIQKVWRGFCFRRKCSKLLGSITKLQAIFRGYQVRKLSSQGVLKAALKITQANRTANENPQMILGSRTSAALLVLQTSKRLTEIMDALRTLEVSTRLSPKCCMAFTNEQAHRILYNLVRSCNRSLPHVELLQTILRTLSNVMKYQRLIEGNATLENTEILLDLIQMFRDKETIFYLTARLLKRIVFSADKYIVSIELMNL